MSSPELKNLNLNSELLAQIIVNDWIAFIALGLKPESWLIEQKNLLNNPQTGNDFTQELIKFKTQAVLTGSAPQSLSSAWLKNKHTISETTIPPVLLKTQLLNLLKYYEEKPPQGKELYHKWVLTYISGKNELWPTLD